MDRFNALGRGMQLMLVGGVLFFIDLFLPWQKYTGPGADFAEAAGVDTSRTAFHGFGGWLLGLLTLILLAWIVARLAAVEVPIPVSAAMTAGVFAFLILFVAVIKALVDDYSGWAAWVGIALAIVIAVGAWMQIREAGGIGNLRTEATSMMPSSASASTATTVPAPPSEPAASPPPPAATSEPPAAPSEPPAAAPEPPAAAPEPPAAPSEPSSPASPPGGESSEPA
jgi:hypothetical protein